MTFLLLRSTPLNLSRSRVKWENVSGKLSVIDVFQNRLFPRINGTEGKEEKTECRIITNLNILTLHNELL